ncbi:MAG: SLBB domain-containing protein [Candidatus Sericytochromatia bacterium]
MFAPSALLRFALVLLLLIAGPSAWAQALPDMQQALERAQPQLSFTRTPPEEPLPPAPGPDYRLGPGDALSVVLWNPQINLSYELGVNPQGQILIPRVGVLVAEGLSLAQVEQAIGNEVARIQRDRVQVRLFLRSVRKVQVLITGYVNRPGSYTLTWGTPLLEALRRAGGVRDNGSVRQLRFQRGSQRQTLDLFRFHFDGLASDNPLLYGGEQIHVPAVDAQVAVIGEVQQAGLYEVLPGERLEQVLEWAGGLRPTADPDGLQRAPGALQPGRAVQLAPIAADAPVQAGDLVYVQPRVLASVNQNLLVQGQVRQPGPQVWRQGMTLLDALELAGGALATADLGAVRLSRLSPEGRRELTVNLQAYLTGQTPENNPALQPDDVIMVPESFFNIRNISELTTLVLSTLGIVSVVFNLVNIGGGQ